MTGRLPRLKWHMLRRRRTDPPFQRSNLEAGLRAGAALEVDVVSTADGHFVCLHDLTLDAETTGTGPVAAATRHELMRLRQRGANGAVLDQRLLFLDEVVAAAARLIQPDGHVQLDLKEPAAKLDEGMAGRLRDTLDGAVSGFILGTTDSEVFRRMRSLAPEIALGFDPLELYGGARPTSAAEFQALAATTVRLGPDPRFYYLEADLILAGLQAGVNLVERVSRQGAEVDAWTVDPDRPHIRDDLHRLVAAGCHQITTNDPEALGPMLAEIA